MTCFKIFILFFTTSLLAQNNLNELKSKAQTAVASNNLQEARDLYRSITNLEPDQKDNWYDLATIEINLKESDSACEHYYRAYLLNDLESRDLIVAHCPNFRNGQIMSINDVEEKPKFISKEIEYELFSGMDLNPVYKKLMIKALKNSNILMKKQRGKLTIQIYINSQGIFDGKILRVGTNPEDYQIVIQEVNNIFHNLVTYIPAKNNGKGVELWEKWSLTIIFEK